MDNPFPIELIGIGLAMLVASALLGSLLQKGCGTTLLTVAAALASLLCIAATLVGGWIGLLVAVLVIGALAAVVGKGLGGQRAFRLASSRGLGFCLSCAIGYWIGGWIGLLAVTLPANSLFWVALYVMSGLLLPLRDDSQRRQAFQSLLSYSLGTNYPYLVMKDRKLEKRVEGNPYKAFFGGPGIVLTGCDHVVVLTDGSRLKPPAKPGLTFTGRFEVVQSVIDLRPQLRAFQVDARTRDGIAVRVLTFVPFRIHWDGQEPTLGKSYPFQEQAILQAVTGETVDQQQDHKHNWDDLVEIEATRIMRDIICHYQFDDLCLAMGPYASGADDIVQRYTPDEQPFPHDPAHDPRYQIRDEMVSRMKHEMKDYGIEVIGGGISNLTPTDEKVTTQRIDNWRAKWQTRIALAHAEGEARRAHLVEFAKEQAEHDLLVGAFKMLSESLAHGEDLSDELLAAAFVTSLGKMAEHHRIKDQLPVDTKQRLAQLRAPGRALLQSAAPGRGHGS
jgi:hypothetical protein